MQWVEYRHFAGPDSNTRSPEAAGGSETQSHDTVGESAMHEAVGRPETQAVTCSEQSHSGENPAEV
jgi:hypothetical protein